MIRVVSSSPTSWAGAIEREYVPAVAGVQVEDLLVEERSEDLQPDERDREERQRVEDAAQRPDVPADPPRLGVGRCRHLGRRGLGVGAHGFPLEVAADRLAQEEGQDRRRSPSGR